MPHEVGTSLELVTIDIFKGEAKTPAILAKNPNGKIPILEDGDLVLWESAAMLAYIAAKAGRTDLAPTTPRERAEVDSLDRVGGRSLRPRDPQGRLPAHREEDRGARRSG